MKLHLSCVEGFEPIETEDEQSQSDDQNTESLSEVTADETIHSCVGGF